MLFNYLSAILRERTYLLAQQCRELKLQSFQDIFGHDNLFQWLDLEGRVSRSCFLFFCSLAGGYLQDGGEKGE